MLEVCVYDLKQCLSYSDALGIQESLTLAGRSGWILFTPNPTISMGNRAASSDLLLEQSLLHQKTTLLKTSRGGKTTYHGPGQIVGFPFGNLTSHLPIGKKDSKQVRPFFEFTMSKILKFLNSLNIENQNFTIDEDKGGIFKVKDQIFSKVLSFGVHIHKRNGVYSFSHGFALNLDRESLDGFNWIIPCGETQIKMDSLFPDPLPKMKFKNLCHELGNFLIEKMN